MKHFVITISREYGSGGRLIGQALAERLGIDFYDNGREWIYPGNGGGMAGEENIQFSLQSLYVHTGAAPFRPDLSGKDEGCQSTGG